TPEELAKLGGAPLPTVLTRLQGVEITRTNNSAAYITSRGGPITRCMPNAPRSSVRESFQEQERVDECLRRERIYYVPDGGERQMGVKRACYPQVWVDAQLMNTGRPTMPFDLATFSATREIAAIEWYESESQTPPRYGN